MKNVTYSTHVLSRKTSKVDGQDLSHTLSQEAGTRVCHMYISESTKYVTDENGQWKMEMS